MIYSEVVEELWHSQSQWERIVAITGGLFILVGVRKAFAAPSQPGQIRVMADEKTLR